MLLPQIPEGERRLLAILFVVYILSRLPLLGMLPLVLDEALYLEIIEEQRESPSLIPTFIYYPVSWKPAPFFWTYDYLSRPLLAMGIPLEAAHRFPSFLFGLLSIPPLFFVLRKSGLSPKMSFYSSLIFLFTSVSIYSDVALLTDAPMFFFITASLWLYIDGDFGKWRFPAAGILTFVSFFFKLVFAFIPPVLALSYFLINDRKTLRNPLFLISLLSAPLAMAINYGILSEAGLAEESFSGNVLSHLFSTEGFQGQLLGSFNALELLFVYATVWLGLSIIGFLKFWRKNLFFSFWYCLIAIPLLSSSTLPWYYLPVLPAISYFSAMLLLAPEGKEKADAFFKIVLGIFVAVSVGIYLYVHIEVMNVYNGEKEAGLMLAGKENVLVIGTYKPSIITYKMEAERRTLGRPLDFGWVLVGPNADPGILADFADDYMTGKYPVTQGSLSSGFVRPIIFRKDSDIAYFDYIAVSGPIDYVPPGSETIYSNNLTKISIYKVK
jgi:hypothetical protein